MSDRIRRCGSRYGAVVVVALAVAAMAAGCGSSATTGSADGGEAGVPSGPPELDSEWVAATNVHMTVWHGPWGRTYGINLTPHETTGIGIWTEEIFVKAMRTGRHMGTSRPIMPPMPWQAYSNLSDEDLRAIFAYLKSLPPVENRVPAYEPPAGTPGR